MSATRTAALPTTPRASDIWNDLALAARDSIIRLATTPAHKGDLESAADEMLSGAWRNRPRALVAGLKMARQMVELHGSAKAAEKAINDAADRGAGLMLDAETC